ncbi:hypothetical protein DYB25_010380 [Aphanomyces astaci]|uniref:Uncharacterized protein n=1 Tax=Aphanomyces astaci TaxID=112090 RepID=A0A396ZZ63_APHAT|nr:hypothetical protein DYB25_010380 [Aphanomyces astaci]
MAERLPWLQASSPLALLPMLVPSTTFVDKQIAALIEHKATLDHLMAISQQWVDAKSTRFKSSHDKKSSSLQHIPTNLHVSWLHHWSTSCTSSTLSTVSCGIPAAHALGLDTDLVQLNDLLTDLADDCVALHASMSAADRSSFGVSGLSNGYDESVEASPATSLPPDVAPPPRAMASRLNSLYSSARRNLPPVPSAFKSATSLGDNHHQTASSPLTSLWARALQLEATHQLRKTMVVAHALTALTAAFQSAIVMTMQQGPVVWADRLALWQRVGFLCGWESLVRDYVFVFDGCVSQGKELHMLHDAHAGIVACQQFQFQLVPSNTDDVEVCGNIVQVPVDGLDVGGDPSPIPIVCVLFTQGINEMQSLANMSAHLGVGGGVVSTQSQINTTNLIALHEYHQAATKASHVISVDTDLDQLRAAVTHENGASKNTHILHLAARVVRALGGARVTCCKSGKDRTAMSVTWEQAAWASSLHQVLQTENDDDDDKGDKDVLALANLMREFGVRLDVAHKNVGHKRYSFNALQRKLLPPMYRPPVSTIQDMVTSVALRDS